VSEQQATILVVDDDAAMTSALCEVLRQTGYVAISAQSGTEALEESSNSGPAGE
jgi:CheY-like chemotaxis protein